MLIFVSAGIVHSFQRDTDAAAKAATSIGQGFTNVQVALMRSTYTATNQVNWRFVQSGKGIPDTCIHFLAVLNWQDSRIAAKNKPYR